MEMQVLDEARLFQGRLCFSLEQALSLFEVAFSKASSFSDQIFIFLTHAFKESFFP